MTTKCYGAALEVVVVREHRVSDVFVVVIIQLASKYVYVALAASASIKVA